MSLIPRNDRDLMPTDPAELQPSSDTAQAVIAILQELDMDVRSDDHELANALIDSAGDTAEIVATMRFYGLFYPQERLNRAARAITETVGSQQ